MHPAERNNNHYFVGPEWKGPVCVRGRLESRRGFL